MPLSIKFTIQDWLIVVAFFIIILCVLEIRKLRKSIAREIQQRLLPQLILDMNKEEACFYLRNEGFSIVQDIQIEDSKIVLEEFGFKIDHILKFENRDFLKPKESIKLEFKVFDQDQTFRPEVTERIFYHLISPSFTIEMTCSNIEGHRLRFIFSKKGEKFFSQIV